MLIPEIPFRYEPIAAKVAQRERSRAAVLDRGGGRGGDPRPGALATVKDQGDEFRGVPVLGGIASAIEKELARRTGKECRSMSLGHLLRGGGPTTFDRQLALRFGAAAIRFRTETSLSGVVAIRGDAMDARTFELVTSGTKTVPARLRHDQDRPVHGPLLRRRAAREVLRVI
jgi:6-phosphofructokinase